MIPCDTSHAVQLQEIPSTAGRPLSLKFGGTVPAKVRSRVRYAFRVFAAVYARRVIEGEESEGAIYLSYGASGSEAPQSENALVVPARYRLRSPTEPSPRLVTHEYASESFSLFFGVDEATGHPDWLGEIFEWLSCRHEMSALARDTVGRIPFSGTLFARQQLSPRKPYATMIMVWLAGALEKESLEPLRKAPSPIRDVEHLVVSSHDIDFYYTARMSAIVRVVKNLVLSFRLYGSWEFFRWNAAKLPQLLVGNQVAAYLPALLEAGRTYGFQSTLFVVPNGAHRRDPNYTLQQLVPALRESLKKGFSIGVHGSYQSIVEARNLKTEVDAISDALGAGPLGGRQHWLRFDRHEKLFETVEEAGLVYDSTLGFVDTVGFRNGASFAFPPYDFGRECAHEFLEIPLVLMDGALAAVCRASGEQPDLVAQEILQASRKWGWGGVAVDWHNPMEPIQVPSNINNVFWQCVTNQVLRNEKWVSANQLLRLCVSRYQAAGLLQGVRCDA